jgi:hypothetical protein
MVPLTIRRQLRRAQNRENRLRFAWAAARWLVVLVLALVGACLLDFFIDRWRDTPQELRVLLLVGQLLLWSIALTVVGPLLFRRLSDSQLALWVEERLPRFRHRLVSAVQLNQPQADTRGMSPEMIAALTREAEEQARQSDFAALVDGRRRGWSLGLLAVVAVGVAAVLVLWPQTAQALLARLFLKNQAIPRSVALEGADPTVVWREDSEPAVIRPAGEEMWLRFRASGTGVREPLRGQLRLDPEGGRPSERYELAFQAWDPDGSAIFAARVPPSLIDATCWAWLGDGRTRQPVRVHLEPRPVVIYQEAAVVLPTSIGQTPDGSPFVEPQKGGDIIYRLPGSLAAVSLQAQKPLARAQVEILGPPLPFAESRAETVRRRIALLTTADGQRAAGSFPVEFGLRPELPLGLAASPPAGLGGVSWTGLFLGSQPSLWPPETGYRLRVWDRFGLENTDPPRRTIRSGPIDPPLVALKPETFWKEGDLDNPEEREVEGIPVLSGQRFRLEYTCSAPYGLSHARLRFRVLKKAESTSDETATPLEQEFLPLPLGATRGAAPVSTKAREEFSTAPLIAPDLPGERGGGRYDFDTTGIPDGQGGVTQLEVGDRIQFFVEVFGRADPDGPPGRSAVREKEVVALKDFLAWLERKDDQKEKIRQLEEMQRSTLRPR